MDGLDCGLIECEQFPPGGRGSRVQGDVDVALAGGAGIDVQEDMADGTVYVHASGSGDMAVELVVLRLGGVQAEHVADSYPNVQAHVLEVLVVDSAGNGSLSAFSVGYGDIVEYYSLAGHLGRAVDIIGHSRVFHFQQAVLDLEVLAVDLYVRQGAACGYLSGKASAHPAEYAFQERLGIAEVEPVEAGLHFEGLP